MFNLGLDELLVIGILAAFFLDAKKLAQAFKWIRVTRYRLNNLQYDIEEKVDEYLNLSGPPSDSQARISQDHSPESTSSVNKESNQEPQKESNTDNPEIESKDQSPSQVQSNATISSPKGDALKNEKTLTRPQNSITQVQARDLAKFRVSQMNEEIRDEQEENLLEELDSLNFLKDIDTLAAFIPLQDEANILEFLENWVSSNKKLILPRVDGEELKFYQLESFSDLTPGSFGILEPSENERLSFTDSPEAILVPGVAFDHQGNRVGRGKGYYDRYLSKHPNSVKIGICFEKQLLNGYISQNSWDIPMDYIVSSRRTLILNKNK